MEVFTKSLIKWSEPKSFNEYYEAKINELNPQSKIIYSRYVFPTILSVATVVVIFGLLSLFFNTDFVSAALVICLIGAIIGTPIIQFASKYDKKSIYFYKRKILIYGSDEGRQDLKIKDIQRIEFDQFIDGSHKFDILKIYNFKGKEFSVIINPDITKNEIIDYFSKENIKIT